MADLEGDRAGTPSIPETNGEMMAEKTNYSEEQRSGETGMDAQSDAELERLIDQELENVGTEESEDEKSERLDAQQREIDEELRKLREELEMDSSSPDELNPDYDIAARVKQLNEELAKEGPIEEKKNRKVNFPENVISMAVPPADYPEDTPRDGEVDKVDGESGPVDGDSVDGQGPPGVRQGWGSSDNGSAGGSPGSEQSQEEGEKLKHPGSGGPEGVEGPSMSSSDSLPNRTGEMTTEQNKVSQPHHMVSRESTEDGALPQDHQNDAAAPNNAVNGNAMGFDGSSGNTNSSTDPNDLEVERLTLRPQVQNNRLSGHSSTPGESSSIANGGEEEYVLVERGGKFFHVHVNDLSPEERHILGLQDKPQSNGNGSELPQVQPRPPQKPRPSTATGGGARGVNQKQSPRRVMSAKTAKEYDQQERRAASYEEPFGNPRSRYGMTPEQKEFKREQARLRMEKMKKEKEQKEREEREKEELSQSIFKAWVDKKNEEIARQRKEERERKKAELENKEERFPEEAFKAWLDRKKDQRRSEHKVQQQLTEEQRQAYFMRSREDCERAFKEWKKSKNAALRQTQSLSRAGALETKKRAKASRKSRNLAKALEVSQNYRYTEYYGYRL